MVRRFEVARGRLRRLENNNKLLRKALELMINNADQGDKDGFVVIALTPVEWQQVMRCMTDVIAGER